LEGKAGVGPANGEFAVRCEKHEATILAVTGFSSSLFFLDYWILVPQEDMIRRSYFITVTSHLREDLPYFSTPEIIAIGSKTKITALVIPLTAFKAQGT
jgi:hypothetical protein